MVWKRKINILVILVLPLASVTGVFYACRMREPEPNKVSSMVADPKMQESPFTSKFVSQVVVHPKDPNLIYATVVGQGVFKSRDRGVTWLPMNKGIKNLLIFQLVIDPSHPDHHYLGTFGGGVYRSEDGGGSWVEVNQGLTNTTIEGLTIHPREPGVLYAATTNGGVFKTEDGGTVWIPFNQGLPGWDHNSLQSFLLIPPSNPTMLYLGNYQGLFQRKDLPMSGFGGTSRWLDIGKKLKTEGITYFLHDPRLDLFYAATRAGRLYKSVVGADRWSLVTDQLKDDSIYSIVIDPSQSGTLYAAVGSKGIIKSTDQGATWKPTPVQPADQDVRSLAIDPQKPQTLYIGTKKDGLWMSRDGGARWVKNEGLPVLDWALLLESVQPRRLSVSSAPKEFEKCNACHGWSDSVLNSNLHTAWLVTPTARDWTATVDRMKERAKLEPAEAGTILQYLSQHYGMGSKGDNLP